MTSQDKNAAVLDAFQRFLQIQETTQSKFNGFVQCFNSQMTTFFREELLPLTLTKLPSFKNVKLPEKKSEPTTTTKRPRETITPQPKKPKKPSDLQVLNNAETIKSRIRELYLKNIDPLLICKLFNLKLDLIHSIGDWKNCSEEIKTKMQEQKLECLNLRKNGMPIKAISKALKIPKKKVLILLGEISPHDLLKSAESKKAIINKIKEGAAKVAIAKELEMPIYKLQYWIDEAAKGNELSDNDTIHSEGEYDRNTIRNTLFYYYQTGDIDVTAQMCNVYARDVENWVEKLQNDKEGVPRKRQKKQVQVEMNDHHQALLAEFLKKASASSIQSNSTQDQEDEEINEIEQKQMNKMTESMIEDAQNGYINVEENNEESSEEMESDSCE